MIHTEALSKQYGRRMVLSGIDLEVKEGEFFGLIGPSGAGKSTLLRILDLIEPPSGGRLHLFGDDVYRRGTVFEVRRRMAMLFQKPVIFNASVYENIAIGLKVRRRNGAEVERRVREALRAIGLPDYADRSALTLSGGEAQRVALARALVTDPEILFLDEPTANLDPPSVEKIEELVQRLNRESGTTVVLSTHDMRQGQRLADRIGVMMQGTIPQVGTTLEIFHRPRATSIARFVGVENILPGTVTSNRNGEVDVDVGGTIVHGISAALPGQRVSVLFRAEDVTLDLRERGKTSARNLYRGTIVRTVPSGPFAHVVVDCGVPITALVTIRSAEDLDLRIGREVYASFKASTVHVIPEN
ncbi:MAG: ABC transporter ATP-binding protein [Methanomicrobiales archaeon]|nr:ABC transporter ATP-binding protein [Methanomicrobiales archaeon]